MVYYFLNQRGTEPVKDYKCVSGFNGIVSTNPKTYDVPRALRPIYDAPSKQAEESSSGIPFQARPRGCISGESRPASTRDMRWRYALNNSDIQYYVDDELAQPYYSPIYSMPSISMEYDYVDPMGTWKPHYTHQIIAPEKFACLSFINDTAAFREDIIARQQAKYNQTRSEMFF